ncbi:MAG: small multidrug resistance transmembrane protein [uncultured bacterium]|nr:MAG: small multidrug resistance transmembrane protein [uncultured bacterium]OGT08901.1 MAG: 4-amino-4-deoxy-L-arabinose transferase [Gammaproteobacteria bacterium RBG_16_37_9]HBC71381.1 4-amino-4-deoxy-L-arabinose transferase [Coxiellaceae bacterium]HBY55656.1 4-amino-4-deoxy-L-arabinose transferase [Coxiellaceae bacterium]
MNFVVFALIILSVLFNTAAQIALKAGMLQIGHFNFSWENLIPIILKIIASPWIILGMMIYVGSVSVWLLVLSRTPISIAYPMASLGYITSAIAAYYLWGEDLTLMRIAGIIVILVGVYMVAKT